MDKRMLPRYRELRSREVGLHRKTLGGENVGRLFVREGWDGREQLLFDRMTKKGHRHCHKAVCSFARREYVALGLAAKGANGRNCECRVSIYSQRSPESIHPAAWFGVSWLQENRRGVLYNGRRRDRREESGYRAEPKGLIHDRGRRSVRIGSILSSASTPELDIAPKELPVGEVPKSRPDSLIRGLSTASAGVAPLHGFRIRAQRWLCHLGSPSCSGPTTSFAVLPFMAI